MNINHKSNIEYPTFTGEVSEYRAQAESARGAVLRAGFHAVATLFRNAAKRISRVNRVSTSETATAS